MGVTFTVAVMLVVSRRCGQIGTGHCRLAEKIVGSGGVKDGEACSVLRTGEDRLCHDGMRWEWGMCSCWYGA